MIKKILIAFFAVVAIVGALGGVKTLQIQALIASGANMPEQMESVTTALVEESVWPQTLSAVGSFVPVQGVALSSEAPGLVAKIHFDSGDTVTEGQLLVELDASSELAQLQSAQASLALAQLRRDRSRELREKNTVAQSDLDAAEAQFMEAEATARSLQAMLSKKRVVAPFSGKLGIRLVNLGQFLNVGTPMVSLQAVNPIYLDFTLPQQRVGQVAVGMEVEARLDAYPDRVFHGKLQAVTPEVSASTRAVSLRAHFENDDELLRPGMFASVAVVLSQSAPVLVAPATSLLYAPYGDSVYILEDGPNGGKVAKQKFVRVLERRGDFVAIEAGLKAGDEIVSTGVFKLRNGLSVVVNNDLAPTPQLSPKPDNT